jgi:hypothetical protein
MSALAMTEPTTTFVVPVSSGIFAHCEKIGVAIWVFMWAIDRTTKETPSEGGLGLEGLVYGGRPIRAQEIAKELQMAPRTVQTHLNHLVTHGYLRRLSQGLGGAAGYAVRRSKKWKPKLSVVGGTKAVADRAEFGEGALISAEVAPNSAGGALKTSRQQCRLGTPITRAGTAPNRRSTAGASVGLATPYIQRPWPRPAFPVVRRLSC